MQLQALTLGLSGELMECCLHVPGVLYDLHATREARRRVRELVQGFPVYHTLEDGQDIGLHENIYIPVELVELLPAHIWRQQFDPKKGGLAGKLAYHSKPRDALACRSNHRREVPPLLQLIADERLLEARKYALEAGRVRLPAASGVMNLPLRLKPPPALLLVYLYTLETYTSAAAADLCRLKRRRCAVLALRQAQEAPRRLPAPDIYAPRRWPAHGLPVRRAVPLLVGHARPPPQTRGSGQRLGSLTASGHSLSPKPERRN